MSIYTKPISQLTNVDLQELLTERAVENTRLEFKLIPPSKEDTLKKLSAFANTFGGLMVVGAKEDGANGRIEDLPGIDPVDGYKQKVVQWCFDGASPPVIVEVSDPIPVSDGSDKVCFVVSVPESDVAPHFLNGRKGIWVRTNEFNNRFEAHLAEENELRHLLDRRRLVQERRTALLERAEKRFRAFTHKQYTDRAGYLVDVGSLLEFSLIPRFPSRPLCRQELLSSHIQNCYIPWRQTTFPASGAPILSQHESAIVLNTTRGHSIFEVNVWGSLFYATKVDRDHNGTSGIHLYEFVGYVLLFIRHAGAMFQKLGYSGTIVLQASLAGIHQAPWLIPQQDGFPHSAPGSELDNEVSFAVYTTVEQLIEKPDAVAIEILRFVLFSMNLSETVDRSEKLENLIRRGYKFNFWENPVSLKV